MLRVERVEVAALEATRPLRALHHAEADRVHADLIRRVLLRERLGEIDAGGAGHRGRQRLGQRRLAADRRDVEDRATAARLHRRHHEPAEAHRAHHLEVEVVLPRLVGDVEEGRGLRRPRVVDQDVDAAPAADHLVDELLDLVVLVTSVGSANTSAPVFSRPWPSRPARPAAARTARPWRRSARTAPPLPCPALRCRP